jgi:hypothetical protein
MTFNDVLILKCLRPSALSRFIEASGKTHIPYIEIINQSAWFKLNGAQARKVLNVSNSPGLGIMGIGITFLILLGFGEIAVVLLLYHLARRLGRTIRRHSKRKQNPILTSKNTPLSRNLPANLASALCVWVS